MGPIEIQVLRAIREHPGINASEVCRLLNGCTLFDCRTCRDYVNPDRRRWTFTRVPSCRIRKGTVKVVVTRLIGKGLVRGDRKRVADPRMSRGWDLVVQLHVTF